jgi:hypothetical protein
MDFFTLIIYGILCFVLGWRMREAYAKQVLKNFLTDVENESPPDDMIPIVIERHNNTFFVYDDTDNSFMAQGNTRKELEENLSKRFPEKKFMASPANLKEVGFDK